MTPPPKKLQDDLNALLTEGSTPPDQLTTLDLQFLAYAIRVSDDPTSQDLAVANALDSLSELKPDDAAYLKSIAVSVAS